MNSRKVSGCSRSSLQLHRVEAQHAVDGEVRADIAQERDVGELVEPVGVVHQDGAAILEADQVVEAAADLGDVLLDGGVVQQRARLVAERWVADLGGAAAHQHDRAVPGLLHAPQHHDRHQVADVQRVRRRVVADVGHQRLLGGQRVERRQVGRLVDVAALAQELDEVGLVRAHGTALSKRAVPLARRRRRSKAGGQKRSSGPCGPETSFRKVRSSRSRTFSRTAKAWLACASGSAARRAR